MALSPANASQFQACFPNWITDSLADRTDIEAGSKWGLREIGSFKLLRTKFGPRFPYSLNGVRSEAIQLVEITPDLRAAVNLLGSDWQQYKRSDLLRLAGTFSPFFSILAEVLEQSATPNPNRFLRGADIVDASDEIIDETGEQSSQSSSYSELSSSPAERPIKRVRQTQSEDSYHPSLQSDQSAHDRQIKSEITTNACAFYFLQCVTESTRNNRNEHSFRLEWALMQDTFTVNTPRGQFSTTNDGNLVYRAMSSGFWKRYINFLYCSIEVILSEISCF